MMFNGRGECAITITRENRFQFGFSFLLASLVDARVSCAVLPFLKNPLDDGEESENCFARQDSLIRFESGFETRSLVLSKIDSS